MPADGPRSPGSGTARRAGRSAYEAAIDVVLTGFAVIVPLVVTLYILQLAFNFVAGALQPFVALLSYLGIMDGVRNTEVVQLLVERFQLFPSASAFVSEFVAVIVLSVIIVTVGVVARNHYGERLIDVIDAAIVAIPGVGTVYKSFRRMTDVMMESDVRNFRDVKLVEYPIEGSYLLGFETNESPPAIQAAAGYGDAEGGDAEESDGGMTTLFLPLAPNPVMGGFLAHIPNERVHDVEMTVEEGVRTIVTSGVGVGQGAQQVERADGPFEQMLSNGSIPEDRLPDSIYGSRTGDADAAAEGAAGGSERRGSDDGDGNGDPASADEEEPSTDASDGGTSPD